MRTWVTFPVVQLAAMALSASGVGAAEPDSDFFKDRRFTIVVGFAPGGGYDAYARLIGRHMVRHLPNQPTFVAQNMPGAGTKVAANWLYAIAPKDGTVLATVVQTTPVDQVLGEQGIQFDAAKFNWIGNPIVDNLVTLVATAEGLRTLEDVKAKGGLVCGSSGGGPTQSYPRAISQLIGREIKVVSGYTGVTAINLAIERKEVNCIGGTAWSSMKATMAGMMKDKVVTVLVQWGAAADPEISAFAGRNVPLITAYARDDLDRTALGLVSSTTAYSRPLLGPPGIPAHRVDILRKAFDETMKDPEFLAEADKAKLDIKPMGGAEIQRLVGEVVGSAPDGLVRARQLME